MLGAARRGLRPPPFARGKKYKPFSKPKKARFPRETVALLEAAFSELNGVTPVGEALAEVRHRSLVRVRANPNPNPNPNPTCTRLATAP